VALAPEVFTTGSYAGSVAIAWICEARIISHIHLHNCEPTQVRQSVVVDLRLQGVQQVKRRRLVTTCAWNDFQINDHTASRD
jgi:hypothetical protein